MDVINQSEETTAEYLPCRFCLQESGRDDLIVPCGCKGTSAYCHLHCLRQWQGTITRQSRNDARAWICNVCQHPYSHKPDRQNCQTSPLYALPPISLLASGNFFCFTTVLCLTMGCLAAMACAATFWLAAVLTSVLTALGVLTSFFALLLSLVFWTICNVRFPLGTNFQYWFAPGASPDGIRPGSLLVASTRLDGYNSIFSRSVVLITDGYGNTATRGVILDRPIRRFEGDSHFCENYFKARGATVNHLLGGPILSNVEPVIVHNMVRRSWRNVLRNRSGNSIGTVTRRGRYLEEQFQLGIEGRLSPDIDLVDTKSEEGVSVAPSESSSSVSPGQERAISSFSRGPLLPFNPASVLVQVFHGISAWDRGQLQGEITRGLWGVGEATASDIFHSHRNYWSELIESERIRFRH